VVSSSIPADARWIMPKPCMCVGCEMRLDSTTALVCGFACRPFPNPQDLSAPPLRACGISYHPKCIQVGEPFWTCHDNGAGFWYPAVAATPGFVCEACTVRAMLGRELTLTTVDHRLLCLECMHLIDAAHAWAPSLVKMYQTSLHQIHRFEQAYQVTALPRPRLVQPPIPPAIAVMWAMQEYAVHTPKGSHPLSGDQVKFNTMQAFQSAAAYFYDGAMLLQHPDSCFRDEYSNRPRLSPGRIPSDHLGFTHI